MKTKFTTLGIILMAAILWLTSQNGSPEMRSTINGILGVLLLSMCVLNWSKISPILFKEA